jgi:chromosome segregation ATPase
MNQDGVSYLQELRAEKTRTLADIERILESALQKEERLWSLQKMLDESQWYLEETRTQKAALESALDTANEQRHALETELEHLRTELQQTQKDLQDTQWFLGEERSRNARAVAVG